MNRGSTNTGQCRPSMLRSVVIPVICLRDGAVITSIDLGSDTCKCKLRFSVCRQVQQQLAGTRREPTSLAHGLDKKYEVIDLPVKPCLKHLGPTGHLISSWAFDWEGLLFQVFVFILSLFFVLRLLHIFFASVLR